ncbi:hypothetical protein AcW1_008060 [Taiwanofungus camphoratus]|nr:hypothetical protein AcV5_008357 [Antrodia cinnamomea]KAI0950869.1 hypothetical protein AcW1_008060 [Antrodia cinnamomea]
MAEDAASSSRHHNVSATGEQTVSPSVQNIVNPTNEVVMTHEARSSYSRSYNRRMINQYEFDHRVGRGQHGEVYLARDTSKNGMEVAIKAVKRKNVKVDRMSKLRKRNFPSSPHVPLADQLGSTEHKIRKEIAIMKKCRHPHVVRLLEVIDDKLNEKIYMVMEYLGGGEIKWRTPANEPVLRVDQTRRICRDVILGLEYLHHQGIIHRDIKPANLLWSADRRTVKITDFGVSHFSYAQRLAAAGIGAIPPDDPDPILMDDSDLSKTAGTPMFLAPEIVSDTTADASSSALQLSTPRRRPAITKAIDVWAFGVTLYGLLFGCLPFDAQSEYEIYKVVRRQDWDVPATMGMDRLPVGGRYQRLQPKGEETEGYLVIKLLQLLLEKDVKKRITLDQVKRHPWILRDIADSQEWLRETQLDRQSSLEPTPDETSSAMSLVRFRWSSRLTNRISLLLRNVRPQRSFWSSAARNSDDEYKDVGVRSVPDDIRLSRHRSTTGAIHRHQSRDRDRDRDLRDKNKQRLSQRVDISRNKSSADVSARSKNFEPYASGTAGPSSMTGSAPKRRRGSFPSKIPETMLQVPKPRRIGSPQPSPQSSSPGGEQSGQQSPEERPRSRLSLSWMRNLRGSKQASYGPSPHEATTSAAVRRSRSGRAARERLARRSEDAFNSATPSRRSTTSGRLSLAMRAASWGEVAEYARPSEDLTSLYSGERAEEALDDDTLFLGAGGVAQSPVPSIPSGLLSTVSSTNSLTPGPSVPPSMSAAHAILQRTEGGDLSSAPDPAAQDTRQTQMRLRTTSPLARMSYNPRNISLDAAAYDEYDDDSMFEEDSRSSELDEVDLQPSTSQMYQDEDEESDDEDQFHLEVRPRRTSEMSPPRTSESSHRDRAMICI